jgi:predicted Kef-type K+ transport protein
VVGYLAVGLAVSPFTPGYTANRDQLQTLADIGVVLLAVSAVAVRLRPTSTTRT